MQLNSVLEDPAVFHFCTRPSSAYWQFLLLQLQDGCRSSRCHLQADVPISSKEEAVFPPVYFCLLKRKTAQRCFQLTSTQVPFTRIDSQAHALTDKGYGVDVNSDWHRSTRGSNGRVEEKDIPQEKEQWQRQDEIACGMCNIVWCALFRPIILLPLYTLSYTQYMNESGRTVSFMSYNVCHPRTELGFVGPYKLEM